MIMDHHRLQMMIPHSKTTLNLSDQESAAMSSSSMEFSTTTTTNSADTHLNSLLCSLSHLKDKVHQVHSIAASVSPILSSSSSVDLAGMAILIQEIIVTASGMMFNCQQMAITPPPPAGNHDALPAIYPYDDHLEDGGTGKKSVENDTNNFLPSHDDHEITPFYWYNEPTFPSTTQTIPDPTTVSGSNPESYDIIEVDAAELLAKYTHYCQVCGKGFKRDANLRMHMRAHGEEYKSSASLRNPMKEEEVEESRQVAAKKYSCPQEGCRWNKRHAKFQPLKSMVCVKNHYKRSHCPKMYMCNRCNRKQFSVLSDLRTHEKHCGDQRWRCSCGTTFSRKDKLMGHVSLFVGHSPVGLPVGKASLRLP